MKKLELPEVKSELQALWKEMDTRLAGKHKPTERETSEEIQRHRREKKNLAKAVLLNDRLVKKSRGRLEAEQIIRRFRDQR